MLVICWNLEEEKKNVQFSSYGNKQKFFEVDDIYLIEILIQTLIDSREDWNHSISLYLRLRYQALIFHW